MMTIQVEGWEKHVFKIAIDLLCKDNIFVRQEENEIVVGIAIGSDSLEKVRNEDFATTHTRWLSWGTAIEMLMKLVFLKHLPSAIVMKDSKNPRNFTNIGFEGAFENYFKSTEFQVAFKWNSCKCYREFANFIGEFPRFQLASFDLTEWRNVKVRLRTWYGDPDCSRLLSTDHFSRNFWTHVELSDPEAIIISESTESVEIITFSDDDEPHGSHLMPILGGG